MSNEAKAGAGILDFWFEARAGEVPVCSGLPNKLRGRPEGIATTTFRSIDVAEVCAEHLYVCGMADRNRGVFPVTVNDMRYVLPLVQRDLPAFAAALVDAAIADDDPIEITRHDDGAVTYSLAGVGSVTVDSSLGIRVIGYRDIERFIGTPTGRVVEYRQICVSDRTIEDLEISILAHLRKLAPERPTPTTATHLTVWYGTDGRPSGFRIEVKA